MGTCTKPRKEPVDPNIVPRLSIHILLSTKSQSQCLSQLLIPVQLNLSHKHRSQFLIKHHYQKEGKKIKQV